MLSRFSHVQLFMTLWSVAHRLLCLWDSPGENTGVGCHAFLQGDLLDPRIEPSSLVSPALQVDSLPLSHRGSPIRRWGLR